MIHTQVFLDSFSPVSIHPDFVLNVGQGGETLFHVRKKGPPLSVSPSMGLLLLHWTGHDFLLEGSQVLNGEKWLLRTDVFFPKPQPQARGGGSKGGKGGGGGKRKSR